MLALFAERLTWYYQGYPPKSVLKLTISLLLLWLCSVHHHLPVLVWLWLSLSLLYKSLKEKQSVNIQWAYSRFISGIKRLFISGGLLSYVHVFSISVWLESTLYAMKHSFEFKLFLTPCVYSLGTLLYISRISSNIVLVYFAQKNKTEKFQIFN